ncbi:hypothetical protein [Stakelama pacifica]|uniref:Uncharacterized protein n=1 Tax=Stakelama pacifica TaxID=517720 RepID=A0A4R6FX45_9SPHN|nr:hypothetical protein [Stakelama pacifica]TDN86536.1 hypothetical protein EV664_101107 [Stakelama pacifica]GGO89939.1 hypothetical protein GCM10011329_01080 [Stakelama pacifica]
MEFEPELAALIARLCETPLLDRGTAHKLHRAAFEEAFPKMLQGQTFGQAMGGLSILNQPEDAFRAELKSIDNDLGRQIGIVNDALDQWFTKGEAPPPYYAWRIAVILSKAKRKDEEGRFLAAWCKHFGATRGNRYEALADRARKLGVY